MDVFTFYASALAVAGAVVVVAVVLYRLSAPARARRRRVRARWVRAEARASAVPDRSQWLGYTQVEALARAAAESDEDLRRQLTTLDVNVCTPDSGRRWGGSSGTARMPRCATMRDSPRPRCPSLPTSSDCGSPELIQAAQRWAAASSRPVPSGLSLCRRCLAARTMTETTIAPSAYRRDRSEAFDARQ